RGSSIPSRECRSSTHPIRATGSAPNPTGPRRASSCGEVRDFACDGMPIRRMHGGMHLSIRFLDDEAELTAFAIWRQAQIDQRLVDAVVPGTDFQNASRLLSRRDLAAKLLGHPDHLLHLLDRAHAHALPAPDI